MDFNGYTKDLSSVCQDLSSIFIVDNSPAAYRGNPGEWRSALGLLDVHFVNIKITDLPFYYYTLFSSANFMVLITSSSSHRQRYSYQVMVLRSSRHSSTRTAPTVGRSSVHKRRKVCIEQELARTLPMVVLEMEEFYSVIFLPDHYYYYYYLASTLFSVALLTLFNKINNYIL